MMNRKSYLIEATMSTLVNDTDRRLIEHEYAAARFTVDEYFGMVSRDAFAGLGRLELLEGVLVRKMTKNPPHRVALGKTERGLRAIIGSGWHLANQEPMRLSASAPEPDLAVVRGEIEDYLERHPGAADVGLVVEVADESLQTDHRKATTYAAEGVQQYWIVNLPDRCVEAFLNPDSTSDPPHYVERKVYRDGDSIPVVIDDTEVGVLQVADMLP